MFEKEYLYDGEELIDVNLVKETYITFKFSSNYYVLEGNKPGLESLIRILNKLIYKKYNWIRLLDMSMDDEYYTNAPEFFFDKPSIPLEIRRIKKKENIFYDEYDCKMYGRTLTLYLTRKKLLLLKKQIVELIENDDFSEKVIDIKNINGQDSQKLFISYKNVKAVRKYD